MEPNVEQRASIKYLKTRLRYDPATGIFHWLLPPNKGPACRGGPAGYTRNGGYVRIMVDQLSYYGHQLAWAFTYDAWPAYGIDHINRDRTDNRVSNLREATPAQNGKNHPGYNPLRGTTPGRNGKWRAQIKMNYQTIHIGTFATREEAHAAYVKKAKEQFGEFSGV